MMNFIQETQSFEELKQYFIPAIFHRIIDGKKKVYQLSIAVEGTEVIIKKAIKPFVHTGFNKVIMGAVLRMERLFAPEQLQLEVILFSKPNLQNQKISFELINKNEFKIGNEIYIASIMAEYDYAKMGVVTYYPIIYRQVCSNGMMALMTSNFTETIPADKIFDIGCEWSRCTFETYQRKLTDYFELLKQGDNSGTNVKNNIDDAFMQNATQKIERVLKVNFWDNQKIEGVADWSPIDDMNSILSKNLELYGYTEFAVWNAITEIASSEYEVEKRNEMFLNAGKYLANEMEKTLNKSRTVWSDNMVWDDVLRIAR
jgi:hypothetical protein